MAKTVGIGSVLVGTLALACGCIETEEADDLEVGSTTEEVTISGGVPIAIPLDSYPWSGSTPTMTEVFGYEPNFHVNVPGFDSVNRAYIRQRTFDPTMSNDAEGGWRTGTAYRMRNGVWNTAGFEAAIKTALGCDPGTCTDSVCYDSAGGSYPAQIVFDWDDNAYTVLKAKMCNSGSESLVMLRSGSWGDVGTWQAIVVQPGADAYAFAMERPYSNEPLDGPPAVLTWTQTGQYGLCGNITTESWMGAYGILNLIKPKLEAGGLSLLPTVQLSTQALSFGAHSGGGTQVLTHAGRVYAAWTEADSVTTPFYLCPTASKVMATTYDVSPSALVHFRTQRASWSRPTNDGHNVPAILMDSSGHLHVMAGAHNCTFRHTQVEAARTIPASDNIGSPADGWADDEGTVSGAFGYECGDPDGVAQQTYVGFVRDREDRLHLAYRQNEAPAGGGNKRLFLNYQYKDPGGSWSAQKQLVQPPHTNYSVYYHQLTIDRYGNLYLLFSPYTDHNTSDPGEFGDWFEAPVSKYKYGTMFMSKNRGVTWEWASTNDIDQATQWTPASNAVADIDADGHDDVLNVFYKQGMTIHIDDAEGAPGSWWSRARRIGAGTQVLQFPVMAGDVGNGSGSTDSRADLVWVYREPTTNWLQIRTVFAQSDSSFLDEDVATQAEIPFPDLANPNLKPVMGDVNGDGRSDVVLMYRYPDVGCEFWITRKHSNGDGTWNTFSSYCYSNGNTPTYWHNSTWGPLLGRASGTDSRADLVFVYRDPNDSNKLKISVKQSNSSGTWSTLAPSINHTDGSMIHQYPHVLGDHDGDGMDDIVFMYVQSGVFKTRVKYASGGGQYTTASYETIHTGTDDTYIPGQLATYPARMGDVNGDGCDDLIFTFKRPSDNRYRIRTYRATPCDVAHTDTGTWSKSTSAALP
jgi:hypothetical protein